MGVWLLIAALIAAGPSLEDRLLPARQALEEGRLAEAEELYRDLVTLYPHQAAGYQGLAEVFAAQGRRDEAVDLLLELGRELVKVSRAGEAVEPLELAVRLRPEDAEVHALHGRVLGEERRYHEAAAALKRAVELGSTGLETLLYLAASYWETERWEAAEEIYRLALALHAGAFDALFHYGQFLLFQGRAAEAVAPLERAAEKQPSRVDVLVFLARAKAESGDRDGAVEVYERVLDLDPGQEKARYALELLRNSHPRRLPPQERGGERKEDEGVVLTPVAQEAGIDFRHDPGVTPERHLPENMGSGLAWLDYDGDGWWDLYLVQSGPFPPDGSPAAANRLYRNRGDGTFEDATLRSAAGDRSYGQGATAADVDGDGDLDLVVTNYGPDVLLSNRGDGTFEDATAAAGLALDGWSSSAALADADGDGDLDLYVTGYVVYDPGHQYPCGDAGVRDYCNVLFFPGTDDAFFRQNGDGTFTEATLAAGFENVAGRGLGVAFADLDGDGRPDVYAANDLDPNRLYRNRGDGTFEDVSLLSGSAFNRAGEAEAGMGVAVGDVDGDGRPDLLVTNFDVETNTLYRNLGDLQFADLSASSGFGLPSFNLLGFGVALADFDLDGDLDAYVANGHVFERPRRDTVARAQRDLLLLGDGHGHFKEQPFASPARVGRGAAAADWDDDGDPDVAVQNNGAVPELWRNDSERRGVHWLGVELHGRARNTRAIGARVTLETDRAVRVRWVLSGDSYQSSSDSRLLFAWPSGEAASALEVVWPSGRTLRLRGIPEGRYVHVWEPR